jgi:type II secretory pathway component PulF
MNSFEEKFVKLQFSGKMRLGAYRKLIRFLKNGVPMTQALDIMYNHASHDGKKPKAIQAVVFDAWRRNARNGMGFGRAITGWVPDKDRLVIEAGEQAGKLDVAIGNAVYIFEGSKKIKGAIVGGLAYPIFLVLIAVGFMVMFGVQVIPAFEEVMPRSKWEGVGLQMAAMSDIVRFYLHYVAMAVAAVSFLVGWSMSRWTGKVRVFFDKVPPWSVYRLSVGAGFMLSLASMVKAGIAIPQALKIMMRDASPWYYERLSKTLGFVNNGMNIGDALYKTGFGFPDMDIVNDLRAYAALDGFDEILETIGREAMDDTVARIQAQTGILRNLSFVLLGGVFGWIANGIFALQQQIASGAS